MPIEHTQWSVGEELRSTGAHDLFIHLLLRVRLNHHEDDHLRAGSEVERGRHDSLHWLVSVTGREGGGRAGGGGSPVGRTRSGA